MNSEPRNGNKSSVAPVVDVDLVVLSGRALVNAPPDLALDVARGIGKEFPGGRPCLFVANCERMTDGQMAFAMGWYLGDTSRGRVSGSLVLFREVQFLSASNQTLLAQLISDRRQTDGAVSVVASSSVDLYGRVRDGKFDPRLYYLLNVVTLTPRRVVSGHDRRSATSPETEGDSTGSQEP